ncbi:MAG: DUF4292 domain-containing protein [Chitinophagaceae bacterium]
MKKYSLFLLVLIVAASCRPTKKVQSIQTAIVKKDTAHSVIVTVNPVVDSFAIIKGMMDKIVQQKIDFSTFNAKIKVDYLGQEESQNVTAYLSMKKDSIIYIQIKGFLGIVGLQAKITKDSVTIVSKIPDNKYIQYRSISYLQDVTQIPFNFTTLQDLLIGNPVFLDNNIVSYRELNNNQMLVLMIGNIFKHLITFDKDNFTVLHSKLDDVDLQRNRTCDITLSKYNTVNNFQFSTYRNISVAEKSKLNVNMEFKEYSFNETLKYAFVPPKNYKKK